MIHLGERVRDTISGFTGIAVSRTSYLHGTDMIGVRSTELHEGKPIDPVHFEASQLAVVEKTAAA